jgi:tetratricopeptide (TPR) repeat protein
VIGFTWSDPSIRRLLEQAREIYATINKYTFTGPVWTSFLLNEAYIVVNDIASAEKCVSELYEKVKTSGYAWGMALAKWSMAELSQRKGDMISALALWQESSELFKQIEDVWAAEEASSMLLWKIVMRGELEDGIRLAKEDLIFYEEYGDPSGIAARFFTLGTIAREQGQYESARRYFTDAINLGSEIGDLGGVVVAEERDACLLFLESKLEAARAKYQDVLKRLKDVPNDSMYGFAHARAALVSLHENRLAEAGEQLAIGLEVLQKTDPEADIYIAYYGLGELARLEGRYSEAIEFYRASLNALNLGYIYIGFPEPLDGLAKTKLMQSKLEDAARLFGASEGLRKKMGSVIHNVDQPDYDKHIQLLREKMNADELKSAWEAGRQMSLDEAVAYALNELK